MATLRANLWIGALVFGLAFLGLGTLFVVKGLDAKELIRAGLLEEQVKTGKDGVQFGVAEGTLVSDATAAQAQADTIKLHSTAIKGEVLKTGVPATLHYAEMNKDLFVSPEAYTNARNTYLNGLTLRNSLYMAVMGFGVADMAIGIGTVAILLGVATLGLGVPAFYWAKNAEQEVVRRVRGQVARVPATAND